MCGSHENVICGLKERNVLLKKVKGLNDIFYSYQGGENVPFSHILLLDCFTYVPYAQLCPTD